MPEFWKRFENTIEQTNGFHKNNRGFYDFQILSRDSVTVAVDAVVYFRISNATISVTNVEDASRSTKLLAQTTLRNILGTKTLAEMLSDREAISMQMQVS